jgi:hypothetical protein
MMVWSHYVAVTESPGYIPFEKEKLHEVLIPEGSQFYEVIKEREDIYHEFVVKRKLINGDLKIE